MTLTLSAIVGGTEYPLSDRTNYKLLDFSGFGASPTQRITERGPLQHGDTDLGYRLRGRNVQLVFLVRGGSFDEWLMRRQQLVSIFRPANAPLALRVTTDSYTRQLDCHFNGGLDMSLSKDFQARWIPADVSLYAPDPTWYDPAGVGLSFPLGGGGTGTPVPLSYPVSVGASTAGGSQVVNYAGTWDAYPILTLRGPMSGVVITNTSTGDVLDLTTLSIGNGEDYVIDCRYGYKTIKRASDGLNAIQYLSASSDLATFRIGAAPDVTGGTNALTVSASGISGTSALFVQFNTRFVGI